MDELLCMNCQASIAGSYCSSEIHSLKSRVVQLRTCNDAPSDDETNNIRLSFTSAQRRLQFVQDSIGRFEESLESLRLEQQILEDYIYDGTLVLHPIRRTPVDILTRIFSLCVERGDVENLESNVTRPVFSSLDIKGMRWVLGYVCRQWRSVILSSPQLWTDVQLELGDGTLSWRAFLLGIYIGRSQSLHLSVSLSVESGTYSSNSLDASHAYLSVLFPSAHRWKSLFLSRINPGVIQSCFSSINPLLYSLQTLSISDGCWDGNFSSSQCNVFQASPELREVILRKVPSEILSFRVPFRQLRSLELGITDSLSVSRLLDCLGQMQRLEKLVVECPKFTGAADVTPGSSFYLPLLRHLEIRGSSHPVNQHDSADQLLALNLLSLPKLSVLRVSNALTSFASIKLLVSRSCCNTLLTELMTDTKISEEDFIALIADYPSLTSIDFGDVEDLTNRAIGELSIRDDRSPYLSELDTICLRGGLRFDANSFVDMIMSRWKASSEGKVVARLRRIELELAFPLTYRSALSDRFKKDFLRGLQWKVVERQKLTSDIVPKPPLSPKPSLSPKFSVINLSSQKSPVDCDAVGSAGNIFKQRSKKAWGK